MYYNRLGVSKEASENEIKKAYFLKYKDADPTLATLLNKAKGALTNEEARCGYNAALEHFGVEDGMGVGIEEVNAGYAPNEVNAGYTPNEVKSGYKPSEESKDHAIEVTYEEETAEFVVPDLKTLMSNAAENFELAEDSFVLKYKNGQKEYTLKTEPSFKGLVSKPAPNGNIECYIQLKDTKQKGASDPKATDEQPKKTGATRSPGFKNEQYDGPVPEIVPRTGELFCRIESYFARFAKNMNENNMVVKNFIEAKHLLTIFDLESLVLSEANLNSLPTGNLEFEPFLFLFAKMQEAYYEEIRKEMEEEDDGDDD